jgi:hypothetical protein
MYTYIYKQTGLPVLFDEWSHQMYNQNKKPSEYVPLPLGPSWMPLVPLNGSNSGSVISRSETSENRSDCISKIYFERISLNTQCP